MASFLSFQPIERPLNAQLCNQGNHCSLKNMGVQYLLVDFSVGNIGDHRWKEVCWNLWKVRSERQDIVLAKS